MEKETGASRISLPNGFALAPIHGGDAPSPLSVCLLLRHKADASGGRFVLLRELPGSRVYLGAVCDAATRLQEWVEIWVQTVDLKELAFSSYQEKLTNHSFDQRWRSEFEMASSHLPEAVIVTGMESANPAPLIIKQIGDDSKNGMTKVERAGWTLCQDDALLESFGLPPYSISPHRYLHEPDSQEAKTFLAASTDAPGNSHVQGIDRLKSAPDTLAVFNAHAGLIRVQRICPVGLDEYLRILEGDSWNGAAPGGMPAFAGGVYAELQAWSNRPRGLPFLLHGPGRPAERLNEIFYLKLAALRDLFREVRAYVKSQQLPLLNLSPASFGVRLQPAGDHFPALWSAKCALVKTGQAHPLKIKTTEQRYFIRLGRSEPSAFLPEGMGAHSFGIGNIRLRSVTPNADGIVLEGTLVAENYLGVDPHDLLWFKLPLHEEQLEFWAHVYAAEAVGPKEARFRTVPAKLPEQRVASLGQTAGTSFPRSPYEIWPLLSSPCDLHSLGIMAVRILLANHQGNLPVIVDEVLSLARELGKDPLAEEDIPAALKKLLQNDEARLDLVSPHALVHPDLAPGEARSQICLDLWLETICLVLRLFPGAGSHTFSKSFGDVSPVALETVFDRPVQEMEKLLIRLRSVLAPSLWVNEEIAGVLLEQLDTPASTERR